MSAGTLQPGDPVAVRVPSRAPSCFDHSPLHVWTYLGVYLGIPRFEFTIGQVRMTDGSIRRFPLEYLSAVA